MQAKIELGKFLETSRTEAGLDLKRAAELLKIDDPEVLRKYENGTMDLPLDQIFAMTNFYNIPPDALIGVFYRIAYESCEDACRKA